MSFIRAGLFPLVLLAVLGTGGGNAWAQHKSPAAKPPAPVAVAPAAPAAAATPGLNILVVDVQSLLQNSKSAKMVRKQIEEKRAEYAKEISHQEHELRRERDRLQREQGRLSAAALNKKGREFQQKVNELDHSVQSKRQALERSNAKALEKIQNVMLKIITHIAKERKANLVFQRSELVLFDQGFDITDEVLQKLDEELPTVTVDFVTPKEAAAAAAKEHEHKRERTSKKK